MENILIIGGGLMGSAVAWELAKAGEKVTLIEQQGEHYKSGSSYGDARISRSLGPKKDIFSFVHNKTVEEVGKLIRFLNEDSPGKKHRMEDVYTTSPVSYLYHKSQYEDIRKLRFKKQKRDYRKASGDAAFRKFGMTLPDDCILVREYRKHSGTLNPRVLIQKLRLGIERKGSQIKHNRRAIRLTKKEDFYEVEILNTKTNKSKTIQAKKVIVAAGAYTVGLLENIAPYFKKLITPKRVSLSYFKISDQRWQQLSKTEIKRILEAFPMFSQSGKMYFSMIEKIEKNGSPIFKVGGHKMRRNIIDIDSVWGEQPRNKEIKWARKQFRKHTEMLEIYLKKKDIEYVDGYNCVYAVSKDEIPFVTHIFDQDGVLDKDIIVVSGMSGVGAKGCLGYGVLAADLMLGKGESNATYRKAAREFGNPSVRLYTKRVKRNRLF